MIGILLSVAGVVYLRQRRKLADAASAANAPPATPPASSLAPEPGIPATPEGAIARVSAPMPNSAAIPPAPIASPAPSSGTSFRVAIPISPISPLLLPPQSFDDAQAVRLEPITSPPAPIQEN